MKEKKQGEVSIRSSAAEYLVFVAATGNSEQAIEVRYQDENIWITQKMMATLYDVNVRTISEHIKNIFSDGELLEDSAIRKFRITAPDGKGYGTKHYALQMIIAVGFKVNSQRAVQFRKWVNRIAKDYTIQGWAMDKERLMNGGSILTQDYFERLLEELSSLEMIVTMYLDYAEYQARRNIPMTMQDWKERHDRFLAFNEHEILHDKGRVSHEIAKAFAESEFEKYRVIQDRLFENDFDRFLALERVADTAPMKQHKAARV